ncbi:unnamed protein product, partial [Mesorhabditis spiculigera]
MLFLEVAFIIHSYITASVALLVNGALMYAVCTRTPPELKAYGALIFNIVLSDFLVALFNLWLQPLPASSANEIYRPEGDSGISYVIMGPVVYFIHPHTNHGLTCIFIGLILYSVLTVPISFVARYLLICHPELCSKFQKGPKKRSADPAKKLDGCPGTAIYVEKSVACETEQETTTSTMAFQFIRKLSMRKKSHVVHEHKKCSAASSTSSLASQSSEKLTAELANLVVDQLSVFAKLRLKRISRDVHHLVDQVSRLVVSKASLTDCCPSQGWERKKDAQIAIRLIGDTVEIVVDEKWTSRDVECVVSLMALFRENVVTAQIDAPIAELVSFTVINVVT